MHDKFFYELGSLESVFVSESTGFRVYFCRREISWHVRTL